MTKISVRSSRPCDGCALRRVRCEGAQPCHECCVRSIQCTFLRPQAKRGPKGRRTKTTLKISLYQQSLVNTQVTIPDEGETPLKLIELAEVEQESPRLPVSAYAMVLDLFRKQLFSIWPIVYCHDLVKDLERNVADHESYAFAAAVCAGALAQLRIPEDSPEQEYVSAARFEQEAKHYRTLFDYREMTTPSSLLTSLFLHMFWANNHKFRTAEWYLREAVIYLQRLPIHRKTETTTIELNDRELQLRIHWVVYVTERTFCAQHNLEAILDPIPDLPQPFLTEDSDSPPLTGLVSLARVFSYLHKDILRSFCGASNLGGTRMTHDMVSYVQSRLSDPECDEGQLNEVQRVDLIVTRGWIRTLLWHYTLSNFLLDSKSEDKAFSCFLPKTVARDLLVALSSPTEASLRAHGYGIELKVFKVADSLLDVLACGSEMERAQSLQCSSRDTLGCLERILLIVGGQQSSFLKLLHQRMQEMQLKVSFAWWPTSTMEHAQRMLDCENTSNESESRHLWTAPYKDNNSLERLAPKTWISERAELLKVC